MSKLYKEALKRQKSGGWACIVFGTILTLTFFGAIIGIPMIIYGVWSLKSKKIDSITGWTTKFSTKNRLKRK